MTYHIYDTETTGLGDDSKVIQQSALEIDFLENGDLVINDHRTEYYEHEVESTYGALAIHGLTRDKVLTLNPLPGDQFTTDHVAPDMTHMIGHNIGFDYEKVGSPAGIVLLDTLKMCRYLWPDSEHSLGAMAIQASVHFGDFAATVEEVKRAHDAHFDVLLNYKVLKYICAFHGITSWDSLIFAYNSKWKYPIKFSFGKHKGRRIADAIREDRGYASWCLKNINDDPELLEVIRRCL